MTKDTSPDVAGVVERLQLAERRTMQIVAGYIPPHEVEKLLSDAASLLTSQAQEIERLKEGLKPFADYGTLFVKDGPFETSDDDAAQLSCGNRSVTAQDFRRARDLIKGEGTNGK